MEVGINWPECSRSLAGDRELRRVPGVIMALA